MRYPVPSTCIDHEGRFFSANGISPVRTWDGYASNSTVAAVPAPTQAVNLSGSGEGQIAGVRYAYLRYLDADGTPGNVSPLSDPYEPSSTNGTITAATNATPIVLTDVGHGLTTGDIIQVRGVNGCYTANGTWAVTVLTADTFELDGSQGIGDYTDGGTWTQGVSTLTYGNLAVVSDSRVAKRQILRNKDGNTQVFYVDIETTDLISTSLNSTALDDALTEAVTLVDTTGNDLNLNARSEPPAFKRYLSYHQSRMWMVGDVKYNEGAARLLNGSTFVFGVGHTGWTSSMVGWEFFPRSTSNTQVYTISAIDTATQRITLNTAYTGASNPYAYYTTQPGDDVRRTIYFSGLEDTASFDLSRALTMPDDKFAGDITGLMTYSSQLCILFEHAIYRMSYQVSPDDDGIISKASSRGCVNQKCFVLVDDVAYMMDRKGFWAFYGNDQEALGAVIQPLFNGVTVPKINFERTEHFHAAHDSLNETVKWFVCLEGLRYPKHAVCYHYRNKRWWIEEYTNPITSNDLGELRNTPQLFLGTDGCQTLAVGHLANDGAKSVHGTVNGTVTSATSISITDSTATFSSQFLRLPVYIVEGTGRGQRRMISAVTTTKLEVVQPWVIQPDSTSVYQIGGFQASYKTGRYRYVQTGKEEKRGVEIALQPIDDGYLCFRKYEDRSTTPIDSARTLSSDDGDGVATVDGEPEYVVDLTRERGFIAKYDDAFLEYRVDGPRYAQLGLEACPNSDQIRLSELNLLGLRAKGQ
jgi:hypothetical protein